MQKQSRPIGEIFVSMGRLTPADVERALAYQREQGGVFGDALVTLGLLTPEEVKWGLADQYDIPFVQLRPENIDWDVAMRAPSRWAREHTILPVLRHGDTVTAVMADPRNMNLLEEIRRLTGADRVDAALSTAETIQALIEAVHGEADERLVSLPALLGEAMRAGAHDFGVSVRGQRARGWYRSPDMEQHTLDVDWATDLQRLVFPQFLLAAGEPVRQWSAVLQLNGTAWRVQCRAVGQGGEMEWMAQLGERLASPDDAVHVDPALARWLARQPANQSVTLRVQPPAAAVPGEVLQTKLPLLPHLLLAEPRSVHLHARSDADYGDVLAATVTGPLTPTLQELEPFGLDALTLDLHTLNRAELDAARRAARVVVFHARREEPDPLPADLYVCLRSAEAHLLWTEAEPPHGAD